MKKTLIAIALAAMVAPAWGEVVVSSNTVGYTKIPLTSGLNLVGSQFVLTGGSVASMNELTSKMTGQGGFDDDTYEPTTELRTWKGNGYDLYGWSGNMLEDSPAFADELGVTDHSIDNQWLNDDYEVSEQPLVVGGGFWIKSQNGGSVTFSGEVPNTNTVEVALVPGLNLVSYPWPIEVSMDKIKVVGQTGFDDDSYEPTTELRVWKGNGYALYGWSGNLLEESPNFADELGIKDHSLDNQWLNDDYEVSSTPIAIGSGFWIKASGAGKVIFSK